MKKIFKVVLQPINVTDETEKTLSRKIYIHSMCLEKLKQMLK